MSLERICPSCFKGTKYTISLPSSCSYCNKTFTFAFSKKNRVSALGGRSEGPVEVIEDDDEEEIDEVIVASKAREYKRILMGIKVRVESNKKRKIILGDLLNNPDDYKDAGQR